MKVGVVFPQTEIGSDSAAVQVCAGGAEELGFNHLLAYDHVLGADPEVHRGWSGPYEVHTTFHEPMVLFGYLAATTSLELVTGILILALRQTTLVAKQAAEVDILSVGRLRLGIVFGSNTVEYEALGMPLSDRGLRVEEQVRLPRRLWTESSVTYEETYARVTGAGLAPLPKQRPIPIWFGAQSHAALRREGRRHPPLDQHHAHRATLGRGSPFGPRRQRRSARAAPALEPPSWTPALSPGNA